jgi:Holliday junction resolvase RusA-like endonuclease
MTLCGSCRQRHAQREGLCRTCARETGVDTRTDFERDRDRQAQRAARLGTNRVERRQRPRIQRAWPTYRGSRTRTSTTSTAVRHTASADGPRELHLVVVGVPAPQGSMKAFIHKRRRDNKPFAVLTSDNPRTKGWRQTIADVVGRELAGGENGGLFFEGPVLLDVTFYLPRPKDLLTIKKAARPHPHVTKPDLDKLLRAAADSLKHVVWSDDSQITDITTRKRYVAVGDYPRAEITIRDAPPLEDPATLFSPSDSDNILQAVDTAVAIKALRDIAREADH